MPVADGLAAEKQREAITKTMVQNAIFEMGLNKSMTYGEFFKKNKDIYPPRLQKELAPYFAQNADQPMPQFDIGSVKGSDGVTYPTLRISIKGQLHNVQLFGEEAKYAKFNNTTLSETDIINFDDALVKLVAGDEKLRKEVKETEKPKIFSGFPEVNKDSWAKLSPEQRAGYVISMRLLYNDAHAVLLAKKNKKPTKNKAKKFSLLKSLITESAQALTQDEWVTVTDQGDGGGTQISKAPNQGLDSCLVAGYVTSYKGKVCTYSLLKEEYKDASSLAGKAFAACGNKIACNPLVFGTPHGKPICIDRSQNKDVQIATHYEGPCERENHTNSKISFLNDEKDQSGRYTDKNLKKSADQVKAEALKEQQDSMFKETKDYLAGVLKFNDPSLVEMFNGKNPNEQVIAELLKIKNNFDSEIKQATEACKSASQKNGYHEKNFWGACDQLQRRFLFVQEYLSNNPGCDAKQPVNESTLMCPCASGSEVVPGAKCPVITSPSEVSKDPSVVVNPGKCDPVCTDKEECKLQAENNGVEAWQCVNKATGKIVDKKKKKSGFVTFLKKALPWVVGAGVLVGMYYLWKPKKVRLNGAGDICPNGLSAPCGVQCTAPKVFVSGSGCACSACPPGQTIGNLASCECVTQSSESQLVCADGVTVVTVLTDCPSALYTCWDGSKVANVINCPEKPATKMESGTSK